MQHLSSYVYKKLPVDRREARSNKKQQNGGFLEEVLKVSQETALFFYVFFNFLTFFSSFRHLRAVDEDNLYILYVARTEWC